MTPTIFALLIGAAALHAGWNVIVRGAADRTIMMIAVALGAAIIAAVFLPFLPNPARPCLAALIASIILHIVSYALVARAYHVADMGLAYPLMRGAAPLLTALLALIWLHEKLTSGAALGIVVISLGVAGIVFQQRHGWTRASLASAIMNAVLIAAYTLIDGVGVRLSGASTSYTMWVFLGSGIGYAALWAIKARRPEFQALRKAALAGFGGGAASLAAYGVALWAMARVSIPVIAATRETSIAFGTVFAIILLKERVGMARIASALAIMAGAAILRLAS